MAFGVLIDKMIFNYDDGLIYKNIKKKLQAQKPHTRFQQGIKFNDLNASHLLPSGGKTCLLCVRQIGFVHLNSRIKIFTLNDDTLFGKRSARNIKIVI